MPRDPVLGELGNPRQIYLHKRLSALTPLLRHEDVETVAAACYALGHLGTPRIFSFLRPLVHDADKDVRQAVAFSFSDCLERPEPLLSHIVSAFEPLAEDVEADVREWAIISFGNRADHPRIREGVSRPCVAVLRLQGR